MLSYERNFKSHRRDGRYVGTLASQMARMRDQKPLLSFDENMDQEQFAAWKESVREKLEELLCMPEQTEQHRKDMFTTGLTVSIISHRK